MTLIPISKRLILIGAFFVFVLLGAARPLLAADVCGDFSITGTEGCDNGMQCEDGTDCSFDASFCIGIGGGTCAPRDGDGCSADCTTIESGWDCLAINSCDAFGVCDPPFLFSFCSTICGDGIQAGFEACDDEGYCNGDSNAARCTSQNVEAVCGAGVPCLPLDGDGCDNATGFCIPTACGNGIATPLSGEDCDDSGIATEDIGCAPDCTAEPGFTCDIEFGFSTCHTVCGDGIQGPDEECDDGNHTNGDGCDDDVDNPSDLSVGNCTVTACGNLVLTEGEDCDDGGTVDADFDTDFCDSNCTFPTCGNKVVDHIVLSDGTVFKDEECDDGNEVNGDGCDNNCSVTVCGNHIVAGAERCDDGNAKSNDGCSASCQPECGNGIKGPNEGCDDGNVKSGDGCSSVCTLENEPNVCGNAILEPGEECDDGNTAAGDDCESDCTDQSFESANPVVTFGNLIEGDTVVLNAPDPRNPSAALALKEAVLPSECVCTWTMSPFALGHFSGATDCQTQLTLDREGDGTISVSADCGPDDANTFLQAVVVQPRPVEDSGGCSLIR